MRKIKLTLITTLATMALTACAGLDGLFNGGGEGEIDINLYHLTLTTNLTNKVSQDDLKAIYGYGSQRYTEYPETAAERDPDEITELLDAGASQGDIDKAGVRQSDGSYYFFDQDPIYLVAPKVPGYKNPTFYNKANEGDFQHCHTLYADSDAEGGKALERWNMKNEDTVMEARYETVAYEIAWQYVDDAVTDYVNPNTMTSYNFEKDGDVTLLPATTSNPNLEFVGWEYQDTSVVDEYGQAAWVLMEDNKLPINYQEDYMRVAARFEANKFKISFEFELYVDPEISVSLQWEDIIDTMSVHGNLTTIDGVLEPCEMGSLGTAVTKNSVICMDSVYGWAEVFYKLKPGYDVFYFSLNGERCDAINCSYIEPNPYVNLDRSNLSGDSVIKFVVYQTQE